MSKLISYENFNKLPLAYKKSVLSRYFRPFTVKKWSNKYDYLNKVGNELIKKAEYPSNFIQEEVKKALHTKTQRNKPSYKKMKRRYADKKSARSRTRKNRKESKWKLKNTNRGKKLMTRTLTTFHYYIWKYELKFLHEWYKWDLDDWKFLFNEYKKYQKSFENRDNEFKPLISKHYVEKCCNEHCNNQVYIDRNFNIKIEDLFCVMCPVDYEKGAIYLDKLVSYIENRLIDVKKKRKKTLKNG